MKARYLEALAVLAPLLRGASVLALLMPATAALGADAATDAARLKGRLAPAVEASVLAVVDSARAAGLPTSPLVARALEGASQQASGDAIVTEVRRLATSLSEARSALGASSRETEIVAGASALMAGVPADSLARLRASRPGTSLSISLVVLCDLVARGVPQPAASGAVLAAVRAGGTDTDLLRMREHVHDRIQHGTPPTGAAQQGLRELLDRRAPGHNGGTK